MKKTVTKIGIVEDNKVLLSNYTEFFNQQSDYYVCFSLQDLNSLAERNKRNPYSSPQLVLLDINLPGISGLDGIKLIKSIFPKTIIVVLTGDDRDENVIKAIKNGASGYLMKGISLELIKYEIEKIKVDGTALAGSVAKKLIQHVQDVHNNQKAVLDTLTSRERDVVFNILIGMTYKEVGIKLGIKENTVNQHLKNIYAKLSVSSKSELIYKCFVNATMGSYNI